MAILDLLARFLIASMFLFAATASILEYSKRKAMMEAKKMPYPAFLLPAAITFKFLGGLSILFNIYPKIGAAILIIFMIIVTYYFADFWNQEEPNRRNILNLFMANLSIIGGLLLLITRSV